MKHENQRRRGNSRGNKPSSKGRQDNQNRRDNGPDSSYNDTNSKRNDPAWYNKFPELVHVATTLTWQYAIGAPVTIDGYNDPRQLPPGEIARPNIVCADVGVRKIDYIPSYGVGKDVNSPINKAAIELYAKIRKDKSGNPGFDYADIMKMMIAMDSVYQYIGVLQRLYGCLNIASSVNNYIPKALVESMGYRWNDLLIHKADLNAFINTFVVQAAKINVPIGMTVFDRHYFLVTNVFKDEPIDRASLFYFQPKYLYKYEWNTGNLVPVALPDGVDNYQDIVDFGWDLLNSLQRVDDFYTMNSNILKAYEDIGFHRLSALDSNYATLPIFREEMLIQMHNITPVGEQFVGNSLNITEDLLEQSPNKGAIAFDPMINHSACIAAFDQILDIPFDNPSVDDIMEATRFKVIGEVHNVGTDESPTWVVRLTSVGTEIVTTIRDSWYELVTDSYGNIQWTLTTRTAADHAGYTALSTFARKSSKINMSPVLAHIITDDANRVKVDDFVGDVTNYAIVNNDNLFNMHMAALLSQLTISRDNLNRFVEFRK